MNAYRVALSEVIVDKWSAAHVLVASHAQSQKKRKKGARILGGKKLGNLSVHVQQLVVVNRMLPRTYLR